MARDLLDPETVQRELAGVKWGLDGHHLVKDLTFADFREAMAFVNRVAELAEERNHHPDITISWNKVGLRLTTHDRGGLTDFDFDLARAVDRLGEG